MVHHIVKASLKQEEDYRFAIDFGEGLPLVYGDEPPPLGKSTGPTPSQLLAAAVGNCLADSLLFALRKFRQKPEPIQAAIAASIDRNTENRLRVANISVKLTLGVRSASLAHLDRVLPQFEEFCTVSQSVQQGIPIVVEVYDSDGLRLK